MGKTSNQIDERVVKATNEQWVSDFIKVEEYKKWEQEKGIILLACGIGRGKTQFILNEYCKYWKEKIEETTSRTGKILYLCNRNALKDSIKNKVSEFDVEEIVEIKNYQELQTGIRNNRVVDSGKYKAIICDEAHYFISDSFNRFTETALEELVEIAKSIPVIFITATHEEILSYLDKSRFFVDDKSIVKKIYKLPTDYSYVKNICFYQKQKELYDLMDKIIEQTKGKAEEADKKGTLERAIYFCDSLNQQKLICNRYLKKHVASDYEKSKLKFIMFQQSQQYQIKKGQKKIIKKDNGKAIVRGLKKRIEKQYISKLKYDKEKRCIVFEDKRKPNKKYKIGEVKKRTISKLVSKRAIPRFVANRQEEKLRCDDKGNYIIPKDKRVLVSTKCLDNGIDIIDPSVRHIITDITDLVSVIQCLGRKRADIKVDSRRKQKGEKEQNCTFYFLEYSENELKRKYYRAYQEVMQAKMFEENKKRWFEEYGKDRKWNNNLFYVVWNKENECLDIKMNELYYEKLKGDTKFIENVVGWNGKCSKTTYKKEILRRLGMDENDKRIINIDAMLKTMDTSDYDMYIKQKMKVKLQAYADSGTLMDKRGQEAFVDKMYAINSGFENLSGSKLKQIGRINKWFSNNGYTYKIRAKRFGVVENQQPTYWVIEEVEKGKEAKDAKRTKDILQEYADKKIKMNKEEQERFIDKIYALNKDFMNKSRGRLKQRVGINHWLKEKKYPYIVKCEKVKRDSGKYFTYWMLEKKGSNVFC